MNENSNRKRLPFLKLILNNLVKLSNYYSSLFPGKTRADFESEVMMTFKSGPAVNLTADFYATLTLNFSEIVKDKKLIPELIALLISTAYSVEALKEWSKFKNDRDSNSAFLELAWSSVSESTFWLGVMESRKVIRELEKKTREEAAATAVSNNSSKAAKQNSEKNRPLIQEVYRLVRDNCPTGKWKNPRQAALGVLVSATEYKLKINNTLKQENFEDTVYKWVLKMPNVNQYMQ